MASAYSNIPNFNRRPNDVTIHNASVNKSTNSCRVFNNIDRSTDENRCFTECIHVIDQNTNAEITAICGTTDKTCVLEPLPVNQVRDNITRIVSVITLLTNAKSHAKAA